MHLQRIIFFGGLILMVSCAVPIPRFTIEQNSQEAPAEVRFHNQSEESETYHWDFGDGIMTNEANPSHRYYQSGDFTVILEAFKGKKSRSLEKKIHIAAPEFTLVELQTSLGNMMIRLYDDTPQHRDNFIKLVEEGYYDDLIFHRVIKGFMIQGGDPNSREAEEDKQLGMGGPGYTIPAEFKEDHYHKKGALAAARTGDTVNPEKRSSGSQFYIVHGEILDDQTLTMLENRKRIKYSDKQKEVYRTLGGTPFLDQEYTVFGEVIDGLNVIDKIADATTNGSDRPIEDIKMKIISIK